MECSDLVEVLGPECICIKVLSRSFYFQPLPTVLGTSYCFPGKETPLERFVYGVYDLFFRLFIHFLDDVPHLDRYEAVAGPKVLVLLRCPGREYLFHLEEVSSFLKVGEFGVYRSGNYARLGFLMDRYKSSSDCDCEFHIIPLLLLQTLGVGVCK